MQYDGKSKLADAVAELYGYSPRNHNKIANLIQQAKTDLGIAGKAKIMPEKVKQDIYHWLSERLSAGQKSKQGDSSQVDLFQSLDINMSQTSKPTNDKRALPIDNITRTIKPNEVVQHIKQNTRVKYDDNNKGVTPDDFDQLHFGVTITYKGQPKRTTVMLEGFWVKALQRKHGLANNATIRAWIEQEITADGGKFDSHEALTKQVKRMMIESFV